MKKLKTIITMIVLSLLLGTTITLAASGSIEINGDEEVNLGEQKSLKIKVSSSELIGVVSGKIETTGNISNVSVSGINGWNLTYNSETGVFNIYKAEGSKEEEIIEIKYTASNTAGTTNVTASDIKLTTTAYETIEHQDVVKNITIASDDNQGNNEVNNEQNNPIPELNIVENEEENNQENNVINNQENNQVGNNTDNTTSEGKIPQTGEENYILIPIAAIVVLSVVFYIKYMQYRKDV